MNSFFKPFLFVIVLLVTSCGITYRVLLGVDSTPAWKSKKQLKRDSKKHDIPESSNFILDTTLYYDGLRKIYKPLLDSAIASRNDSSKFFWVKGIYNDDTQPTGFRLFDKQGEEIFKLVNCYVEPPIPMNWNVDGCFDQFPPKLDYDALNEHNFELSFLLQSSTNIEGKKKELSDLPSSDYYGVIFWNDFFIRPSRKLINTIQDYVAKQKQTIHLIYVNNHNAYMWEVMDTTTKKRVVEYLNSNSEY